MKQFLIETPHPQGPYGARGVAEHPMISVPGAVGNALANATGVEVFELPLDPESVYLALKRAAAEAETAARARTSTGSKQTAGAVASASSSDGAAPAESPAASRTSTQSKPAAKSDAPAGSKRT